MPEKEYETKYMYRVWYGPKMKSAMFEDKNVAEKFAAEMYSTGTNVVMNVWTWEVKVEL